MNRIIKEIKTDNIIILFWNIKILIKQGYIFEIFDEIFENKQFKRYPKYKFVDITIGKHENNLIPSITIISCKIWQNTNWLDEDRGILDIILNRDQNVLEYSLCITTSVSSISLIISQRIELKWLDLSEN